MQKAPLPSSGAFLLDGVDVVFATVVKVCLQWVVQQGVDLPILR